MNALVREGPEVPGVADHQAVERRDLQNGCLYQVPHRGVTSKPRQISLRVWQSGSDPAQLIECALLR